MFKKLQKLKNFNKFQNIIKFQEFQESDVIKQLLHLNLINMGKKTKKNPVKCNKTITACDIIQLMTFHKVDTVIYQSRGSDVHRSQRPR